MFSVNFYKPGINQHGLRTVHNPFFKYIQSLNLTTDGHYPGSWGLEYILGKRRDISLSSFVTEELVASNLTFTWDWNALTHNPNITTKFIRQNPKKNWDFDFLSNHSEVSLAFIRLSRDRSWNWKVLSDSRIITIDFVLEMGVDKWDWKKLTVNPMIGTWWNILKHPNLDWDFSLIRKRNSGFSDVGKSKLRKLAYEIKNT